MKGASVEVWVGRDVVIGAWSDHIVKGRVVEGGVCVPCRR